VNAHRGPKQAPPAGACRRPESRLAATGTAAVTRSCTVRSATGNPPGTWRSSRRTRVPRAAVKFAEARWGAGSVSKNVLDVQSSGIHWNAGTLNTGICDSGSFGEISEWGPRASTDETGHPVVGRVPQTTCKVPAPADTPSQRPAAPHPAPRGGGMRVLSLQVVSPAQPSPGARCAARGRAQLSPEEHARWASQWGCCWLLRAALVLI